MRQLSPSEATNAPSETGPADPATTIVPPPPPPPPPSLPLLSPPPSRSLSAHADRPRLTASSRAPPRRQREWFDRFTFAPQSSCEPAPPSRGCGRRRFDGLTLALQQPRAPWHAAAE